MSESETTAYRVELEQFSGPLDLLLHLLRQEELEVGEIQVARVCDRYLAHLEELERIDLDAAGEFLVMASTLMRLKSRSLLPGDQEEFDEEDLDPRFELIRQLVEYRRFKRVADYLEERREEAARTFRRGMQPELEQALAAPPPGPAVGDATVDDLFAAFGRLLRETRAAAPYVVTQDDTPLEVHVERLVERLRPGVRVPFRELFPEPVTRASVIGVFLALLELMKQGLVDVQQRDAFGEIVVAGREPPAADGAARGAAAEAPSPDGPDDDSA